MKGKKYRIGDIARIVGMPQHVIRFYETQGIVNPNHSSDNNYRYYDYHDSCNLVNSKLYRSLGFSLPESAELIGKCSHDELLKRLARRSAEIKEEISRLQCQQGRLKEIQDICSSAKDCLTEYRIIERPGFYWIGGGNKEEISLEGGIEETYRRWMEKLPSVYFLGVIPMEALLKETDFNYNWGIAINKENIGDSQVERMPQVKYFPACSALFGVIEKNEGGSFQIRHFEKLLNYIRINNLKIVGPLLMELIEIINEGGRTHNRFSISVSVHSIA